MAQGECYQVLASTTRLGSSARHMFATSWTTKQKRRSSGTSRQFPIAQGRVQEGVGATRQRLVAKSESLERWRRLNGTGDGKLLCAMHDAEMRDR